MSMRAQPSPSPEDALARLASLAPITPEGLSLLQNAMRSQRRFGARQLLIEEGHPIAQTQIILSGWGYRIRMLRDGRRQILGFLLPGDLLGNCRQKTPASVTTVMALTDMAVCAAPSQDDGRYDTGIAEAFAISGALDEHYLFRHITRLGRLSALERLADWILEIHERLALCNAVSGGRFEVPVTQEVIADALGLTAVHINRTLQSLRRDEMLEMRTGVITLLDEGKLRDLVEYRAPVVTVSNRISDL